MDEDFPKEFDLVVVGTGFSESIVAAAASRVGKTVLHLDPNEFYGGVWASFNLEAFQSFLKKAETTTQENSRGSWEIKENCCGIINSKQEWFIEDTISPSETAEVDEEKSENDGSTWTKEKILKDFRRFNIDLIPKVLFGGGKLVELLISSNICRYAEFRAIDKICTIFNDEVKNVPCSRNDVFNTNDLNIIEKRLLMKLLTNCMNYNKTSPTTKESATTSTTSETNQDFLSEENLSFSKSDFKDYEGKTFLEYLKGSKLTDKIIHCVMCAISMCNENTPLLEGIERTKKFLNSLGRYGNTPFLFPMYGCGELPQDFCRLCAVFGGIYCLKRPVENIEIDSEKKSILSIKCNQQEIKVGNLIIASNNIPYGLLEEQQKVPEEGHLNTGRCGGLSRAVFITSIPLGDAELNSGGGGVNILRIPSANNSEDDGAFVIQLSHYSGTCPKGLYLIHITCQSKSTTDPEADLKPYVMQIFNSAHPDRPKILYSAYFMIPKCENCLNGNQIDASYSNLHLTCGPFWEIDYDQSIANAHEIFRKLYPNDEFLPRAPDPEEIVIGGEDPTAVEELPQSLVTDGDENEKIQELQKGIDDKMKCVDDEKENP